MFWKDGLSSSCIKLGSDFYYSIKISTRKIIGKLVNFSSIMVYVQQFLGNQILFK